MNIQRQSQGFSLVELMVAMAAGLVVIGAVVVFTISTAQSSSSNIRTTKVMQDLRGSLNLIEREIRRSGYDENAIKFASACVSVTGVCPVSNFTQFVIVSPSCLLVTYDKYSNLTPGTAGTGEFHGFRRVANAAGVGVIQASLNSAAAPSCTAAANSAAWADVTNPDITNISNLNFTQAATVGGCVQASSGLWVVVQDVLVQIGGTWKDPVSKLVTTRSLEESVRVKNDRVSTTKPAGC